jgi:DNA primase catalytic subunit
MDIYARRETLRAHYNNVFPSDVIYEWIGTQDRSFFYQNHEDGLYKKCTPFKSGDDLAKFVKTAVPMVIHAGACYKGDVPIGREIIFDIDLSDYSDLRNGCGCRDKKKACSECWNIAVCSKEMIKYLMENYWGFKDCMPMFSGGRGIHCWFMGKRSFEASEELRKNICRFFSLETLETNKWCCLHNPTVMDAYRSIALPFYNAFNSNDEKNGDQRETKIKVLRWAWPRIDEAVTKQIKHLSKLPYSLHAKTMKPCWFLTGREGENPFDENYDFDPVENVKEFTSAVKSFGKN